MAKKYQHIDNLFKENDIHTDVQVPPHIKENIDKELFQSRKYRFLLLLLPLLFVGGAAALYFNQNTNNSIDEETIAAVTDAETNNDDTFISEKSKVICGSKKTNDLNIEELELRPTSDASSSNVTPLNSSHSKTSINSVKNSSKQVNSRIDTKVQTIASTNNSSGPTKTSKKPKVQPYKGPSKQENADLEVPNENIDSTDTSSKKTTNKPVVDSVKSNSTADESTNYTSPKEDSVKQQEPEEIIEQDTTKTSAPSNKVSPRLPKNPNPWFISLTGGMNLQQSKFITENAMDELLYRNGIQDKWGFETNLELSYRLKSGIKFGTGIGYRISYETYDFSQEYYRHDTIYTAMFLRDTSAYIYDTLRGIEIDSTLLQHISGGVNKVAYLSIPVQVGTQFIFDKFRLDLFATVRWNLLMNSEGTYASSGDYIKYEGKQNDFYKRSYFDLTFGAAIHYKLYKNLYFSGTARFRPSVTPTRSTLPFEKRLYYTHIGIGLSLAL